MDKNMIELFIEVKKYGAEVNYSQSSFSNTSEYHIINKLFSLMLLPTNINVSKEIFKSTSQMASQTFDSNDCLKYFKEVVNNHVEIKKPEIEKPWWKFWL